MGNLSTRLPWLICAAIVVVPAFAYGDSEPPSTGSIQAYDYGFTNPATGDNTVTIAAGGTVTFAYPSGGSAHNIDFPGVQPATCTQTAGDETDPVFPLPGSISGPGWAGNCRFDAPGTYAFVCDAHSGMTGEVVVAGATPTPTSTATATTTATATQTATPTATATATVTPTATATATQTATPTATATATQTATPTATATATQTATATPAATATQTPAASQTATATATPTPTQTATTTPAATATPAASVQPAARPSPAPAAGSLQLAASQRGTAVRGSIVVARAGSRVQVDVLAKVGGRKPVSVGRLTKPAGAGKLAFSVSLNAKAKKALRKGKLALTVKVTVTPAEGSAFSATRTVSLKR